MSKKNNKQNRMRKHATHLKYNEERERRQDAKIKEVANREADPADDWEDVEDGKIDNERAEEDNVEMNNELAPKKIKKDKGKIKFFQKRVITQEKKRLRKAKKCGVVVYRKAMQTE